MAKPMRVIFCILTFVLVSALIVACVWVGTGGKVVDDDKPKGTESVDQVSEDNGEVENSSAESAPTESTPAESKPTESQPVESDPVESESEDTPSADSESEDIATESSSESEPVESEPVESEPVESEPDEDSSVVLDGGTDPIVQAPSGISANGVDSYFNNSLFVGHSVIVHFYNRVSNWRTNVSSDILGDALFCCTSSFSVYNNIYQTPESQNNVLPKYRGTPYNIEDLPAATGRDTIYLSLMGLNDLGMVGTADTCAEEVTKETAQCIEDIKAKNPDVKIVILASTYLTRDQSYPKLNNRNLSLLNSKVLEYCNANGIDFIDVASPLRDGGGYLASCYSSDDYCHLTTDAYYIWMDALRDYASKKAAGTWKNPQSIPLFE